MKDVQAVSDRAIRSAHAAWLRPDEDDEPLVAPLWRCEFCDSQHDGEPPFEYKGCPVCSDVCFGALESLDDAERAVELAIGQRNMATIAALMFFLGFLLAAFGGRP